MITGLVYTHGKVIGTQHKFFELELIRFWSWKKTFQLAYLDAGCRYQGDHPGINFDLVLLNVTIISFSLYDHRHEEDYDEVAS